jgi:hypothetical protein
MGINVVFEKEIPEEYLDDAKKYRLQSLLKRSLSMMMYVSKIPGRKRNFLMNLKKIIRKGNS